MITSPTIGVLALQGDVAEHATALRACGARVVQVRQPAELDVLDGIVLPGGESTTIDKLLRAFDLAATLTERIQAGLPVYGSCAGMILLADRLVDAAPGQRTLGGLNITVRRNAFGRQVDSFEEDLAVSGVTTAQHPMRAVFIRAPWVEEAAPEVSVLARSTHPLAFGRPVAVRQGVRVATSFHPEVTGDHRFHQYFVDLVRQDRNHTSQESPKLGA